MMAITTSSSIKVKPRDRGEALTACMKISFSNDTPTHPLLTILQPCKWK